MPMIRDVERREDVIYRVKASLREKNREAAMARACAEEQFALGQGQPIDDFWRPLKRHCFWWKIFLVSIVLGVIGGRLFVKLSSLVCSTVLYRARLACNRCRYPRWFKVCEVPLYHHLLLHHHRRIYNPLPLAKAVYPQQRKLVRRSQMRRITIVV